MRVMQSRCGGMLRTSLQMPAWKAVRQLPLRGELFLTIHCKTWQCFPPMRCLDRLRRLHLLGAQKQKLHMPGGGQLQSHGSVQFLLGWDDQHVLKASLAALPLFSMATMAKVRRLSRLQSRPSPCGEF